MQGIISSPLQRCRETAAPFCGALSIEATIASEVGEVETPQDIEDRHDWLTAMMSGTWQDAGLQIRDWRERAVSFVETLPDNTAVFSHFVAINAIVSTIRASDKVMAFKPAHASVTVLERRGGKLHMLEPGSEAAPDVM